MPTTPMPPPSPHEGWRSRTSGAVADDDLRVEHDLTGRHATAVPPVPVAEPVLVGPADDDRRRRGGLLWLWLLLGLLLLGLAAFLLLRDSGDEDLTATDPAPAGEEVEADQDGIGDDPADIAAEPVDPAQQDTGAAAAQDQAAQDPAAGAAQDPTAQDPAAQDPAAQDPAAQDPAAAADPGSVATVADGRELFPIDVAALPALAGQDLIGQRAVVQSVVPGQGFWIGSDEVNRIFVHPAADAALGFEPMPGQRIDFDGFLKPNPAPDSADVHDLPEDMGAEQHRQQGHHIELRSATPATG